MRKHTAQPEWAIAEPAASPTVEPDIHPIPDAVEEDAADGEQVVIKPFPADDLY